MVGGRPGRGRSARLCTPEWAKRWTHLRSAEEVKWSVSETVWRRWPLTTSRTAWARRNTRASLVCFKNGSYLVFCRPIEYGIEVVCVLHASRDSDSLF